MAEGSGKTLGENMKNFAKAGNEITLKELTKWFKDSNSFDKTLTSNSLDICHAKHAKANGKKTLNLAQLEKLIDDFAKDKAGKIKEKLASSSPVGHGVTKTSKTGNVSGMTDASKYTGSHKERFDESGKGKGLEGRKDIVDNSGYVGNYKEKDTYDKKH